MRINKLLALTIALVLALAMTSCGGTKEKGNVAVDEQALAELGVPTEMDYNGEAFYILSAGNMAHEDFTIEEESTLPLENARYKLVSLVEANYNVDIIEEVKVGYSSASSGSPGPGFTTITQNVAAGECQYDLALIAGYDVSQLACNGQLYDLNSVNSTENGGIDLTKPWWDQNAVESLSIKDVTFFTTGEITTSDNDTAFVIIFNKKLANDYQIEDPYQLVKDGEWTINKLTEISKLVSEDLNQDGKMDLADRFGLLIWDDSVVGIVNAAGERCCIINDLGEIEMTIYNETTLTALSDYFEIAYDNEHAIRYQRLITSTAQERQFWQEDHGLFWTTWMGQIPALREMESDFGILPYPKLTTAQESYHSTIAPYNSQYICVPLVQNDVERTGIITEALAYYGNRIVTPVYYDINLTGQSLRDEESEEMLDIIFDTLVYDIGYCFQVGPYNKQLIVMLRASDPNFTTRYDAYKSSANVTLKKINQAYDTALADWVK